MASSRFNRAIRAVRSKLGLTQAQFAEQAGISRQALAAIESGTYLPNVAVAVRIARVAGKTVEELFGERDENFEHQVDASFKKLPAASADRRRVVLARVRGKLAALALPGACLTLPISSGVCLKQTSSEARVATSLLDSEIDATLIIAGCDPAVSILIGWMARMGSRINAVAAPCSSGRALAALADQSVHVAGAHLRDPKSGDYNLAQVQAAGRGRICLINFARWEVGLAMAQGNPCGIRDFVDVGRRNVRIVNRERGAGARQVLDEALAQAGLKPAQVKGYQRQAGGHLEVAEAISRGEADTGVTIRVAAEAYGLGFLPLREERYDLAIPEAELSAIPVSRMLDALSSRRFAREVSGLCAYDTARMGEEIARINC